MSIRLLALGLTVLLLFSACGSGRQTSVLLHTTMGDIRLDLLNNAPKPRDYFIQFCRALGADSLDCLRVLRDNYIEFGRPGLDLPTLPEPSAGAPMRTGAVAFVPAPGGNGGPGGFFIVQGKPQTDASLDALEQKENLHFSEEARAAYKQYGGLPHLHNKYAVFARVVSGMDVVNRIAALPRDAADKPLKKVVSTVEIVR